MPISGSIGKATFLGALAASSGHSASPSVALSEHPTTRLTQDAIHIERPQSGIPAAAYLSETFAHLADGYDPTAARRSTNAAPAATGRKLKQFWNTGWDHDNLPHCNSFFADGSTVVERYGRRNNWGRETCVGPDLPFCSAPVMVESGFGTVYSGTYGSNYNRNCLLDNGLPRFRNWNAPSNWRPARSWIPPLNWNPLANVNPFVNWGK